MAVGVIIPDRGDRKEFLNHCLKMIEGQTLQPDFIELVNYAPVSKDFDLTARVRKGFEVLKAKECDCILIMENDDWYSPNYIERMVSLWYASCKPDIFGTNQTIYYHLKKREYRTLVHEGRSSLMNTLLNAKAVIQFPKDSEIFLDLHLWKTLKGISVSTDEIIAIGMKHGVGLCGGAGHNHMKFNESDPAFKWLCQNVDSKSFNFYTNL